MTNNLESVVTGFVNVNESNYIFLMNDFNTIKHFETHKINDVLTYRPATAEEIVTGCLNMLYCNVNTFDVSNENSGYRIYTEDNLSKSLYNSYDKLKFTKVICSYSFYAK
jgi:hypothetical protein